MVKSKKKTQKKNKSLLKDLNKILFTKEQLNGMLLIQGDKNMKKKMKKLFQNLPNNSKDLEDYFDEIYKKLKSHYIPLILDVKSDKNIFK